MHRRRASHISDDIADAREQARWFPAMVSNHVMDLIERYGFDSEIPDALTEYVKARKFYDYKEHSRVGAKHGEFVTDEIVDRFCVLGNAAAGDAEAEGARVGRRRPVQHLPHDARRRKRRSRRTARRSSRSSRASPRSAGDIRFAVARGDGLTIVAPTGPPPVRRRSTGSRSNGRSAARRTRS